jgi:hypothetical protein
VPHLALNWGWMVGLVIAMAVLLVACGAALWRLTRFT